jgi:hypothetical protein
MNRWWWPALSLALALTVDVAEATHFAGVPHRLSDSYVPKGHGYNRNLGGNEPALSRPAPPLGGSDPRSLGIKPAQPLGGSPLYPAVTRPAPSMPAMPEPVVPRPYGIGEPLNVGGGQPAPTLSEPRTLGTPTFGGTGFGAGEGR